MDDKAVWMITGCSKGLGRELAEATLAAGYRVVATARRPDDMADLAAAHPESLLALALDVTDRARIGEAVAAAEQRFGAVDVLVNNAGYGYFAALEEGEEAEIRTQFETNLFGPLALIRAVLPGMRARKQGHIVNLSSVGGMVTFPGVGYYHMTKFALEALSETLAKEVAGLGLKVTVVEPGAFRTDFRGGSSRQSPLRIADYEQSAGKSRDAVTAGHGKQQGDPARAARAIIAAVEAETPPLHLVLGSDALEHVRGKIAALGKELDAWEEVTRGTDFRD